MKYFKESEDDGLPLGITMGCPVGIGPEILVKLFLARKGRNITPAVVIGDLDIIKGTVRDLRADIQVIPWGAGESVPVDVIPVYTSSNLTFSADNWGKPDLETGIAMGRYIEDAVRLVTDGCLAAIVTCPISKASLKLAGYPFPGHTEMLGQLTGVEHYRMMMAGQRLRVVLTTIHEPLEKVPELLSTENIFDCIEMTMQTLRNDFGIPEPRVAVAALNPHGGENAMFGDQEERIIGPAVKQGQKLGDVSGPWPPDTVFYQAASGSFDAVIAMYHDQGLIPFKLLHFEDGVNVTLGLPIVRTSVDHGTAYDIAGTGKADHRSLESAVALAELIVKNRVTIQQHPNCPRSARPAY